MGLVKWSLFTASLSVFGLLLTSCGASQIKQLPPGEIISRSANRMASLAGFEFLIERSGAPAFLDYEETISFRRAEGKFVYLANSEDAVLESINLAKSDSLAGSSGYKNAVTALPRNRIVTLYMNPEFLGSVYEEMSLYGASSAGLLPDSGLAGIAMSASIVDEGVRLDGATVYDPDKLTDFQKETLSASYLDLTTDALVPGDTFFFAGVNSSMGFGRLTDKDSPFYDSDMAESFDLLESEYGISIPDLFDLLSGEFAFAIGPARDGALAELGEVNMGITLIASTSDEQGFTDWFESLAHLRAISMLNMISCATCGKTWRRSPSLSSP